MFECTRKPFPREAKEWRNTEAIIENNQREACDIFLKQYAKEVDYESLRVVTDEMRGTVLRGIALGDISGSTRESFFYTFNPADTVEIIPSGSRFTDDTIMAVAILRAVCEIQRKPELEPYEMTQVYAKHMRSLAKQYPDGGYGGHFYNWAIQDIDDEDYKSYGDGSAMRAGMIGAMCPTFKETIKQAVLSAIPTHSHPEGVKGAVVTAGLVWLALNGYDKPDLVKFATKHYPNGFTDIAGSYQKEWMSPDITPDEIQKLGKLAVSVKCQVTVPEAVSNFMYSYDFEGCLRLALTYPCDTDTVSAIAGGIAAAYYGNTDIKGCDTNTLLQAMLPDELMKMKF